MVWGELSPGGANAWDHNLSVSKHRQLQKKKTTKNYKTHHLPQISELSDFCASGGMLQKKEEEREDKMILQKFTVWSGPLQLNKHYLC